MAEQPRTFADRLCEATNSHDLDRVADCFSEDYANETPVHPARGFRGHDQLRLQWKQLFAAVPDLEAQVVRSHQVDDTVWSEWQMHGIRKDGARHLVRGVMIFTVADDRASAVRFYLEPVEQDDVDADNAVQQVTR